MLLGVLLPSEHKLFHGYLSYFFADFVRIFITIKTPSHLLLLAVFYLILALVFVVRTCSAGLKQKAG
ncbi:hypothetical protein B9Z19DRAFT_1087851 [Tuber borchii]|uniref:Uncharacterized protein n=1 Tax=Tuber borchii TaxID=42251 RepID=A0A2T6ZM97_TUBBO|nr:hypothetical protein B9Z19DRAFT_1087851 [Tuber borchii]